MWWVDPVTTVVVGGIGFAGVALTIWANGTQARKLELERSNVRAARLRDALYAELRYATDYLSAAGLPVDGDIDDPIRSDFLAPHSDLNLIYLACAADLPNLEADDIESIMLCHGILQTFQGKVKAFYKLNPSGTHYVVPAKGAAMFTLMAKNAAKTINDQLKKAGK